MRIVMHKPLEDCFNESLSQEICLDETISKEFIFHLGKSGELQYFPTFSRPFFRIDSPGRYTLTGIEGNSSLRVMLCHDNKRTNIRHFEELVHSFADP